MHTDVGMERVKESSVRICERIEWILGEIFDE